MSAFIEDLKFVTDLAEGEIAVPESGDHIVYPIGGHVEESVASVIRRGDFLFAITADGAERCVAGDGAEYVIQKRIVW